MTAPDDWPYPDFDPAATADERTALTHFLAGQRDALVRKCDGLDAEQMARRSVEPSTLIVTVTVSLAVPSKAVTVKLSLSVAPAASACTAALALSRS